MQRRSREPGGPRWLVVAVGPAVALQGLAPFLVARFLWQPAGGGGVKGFGLSGSCPLLEHTGVPCASCGASRALFHFVRGDTAFLHYNPFWIVALLGLLAYGLVLTARALRGRRLEGALLRRASAALGARPWLAAPAAAAFVAVPWAVAMLNVGWVRGG